MAAKKKTTKRPPRVLWLVYPGPEGEGFTVETQTSAKRNASEGDRVVGPYLLAERVRER